MIILVKRFFNIFLTWQKFSAMSKNNNPVVQNSDIPKLIKLLGRLLQLVSPVLAAKFASKLFITPIKYKTPKRELHMLNDSSQEYLYVPAINKTIRIYHYGNSDKKVLLVHGWSGRGTQLVKIADELLKACYATISFDAPAHGKSEGKTTIMTEFIASVLELDKRYGNFEFAIGHSLGGMTVLNAIRQNLILKKAVIIGSGDVIQDIVDEFIDKLTLKPEIGRILKIKFEKKFGEPMENYSSNVAARFVDIPVLIVHDEDDEDVPLKAAINIHKYLKNSEIFITKKMGHRKILGNEGVLKQILDFLEK